MSLHANQQTEEVRRTLVDPVRVAERLGLGKGAVRQAAGVTVRCPVHREKTPSCSITKGPDGTLRVRCFGCGFSGDVLTLVAVTRGLDVRRDFRDVLRAAAEVAGLHELAAELESGSAPKLRLLPPLPEPEPDREYPPQTEVRSLWDGARAVAAVECCAVALGLRGLFPGPEVARGITGTPEGASTHPGATSCLPRWARYQGRSWLETGHRVLVPAFDHLGEMRSLRAWRITSGETPKRLPPSGHRATGLVLANDAALRWLRVPSEPIQLLVVEGEPDYLAASQAYLGTAVVGIVSGGWTADFAARVPFGSLVAIHTHHDAAGDRYAAEITKTLASRARIKRGNAP